MDDLLQKETERQRRLLEEARKAVEEEKARLRQGGARRIEPRLDEPQVPSGAGVAAFAARPEPVLQESGEERSTRREPRESPLSVEPRLQPRDESVARLRSIPDIRSALIPLHDDASASVWSKPFSLPKADVEPWLSFLRGYRKSCLFPASDNGLLRVDAAVQALLELKGLDLKIILEPAVCINGPVEYFDEADGDPGMHETQLATAIDRGCEMGDQLYDALLGEGYINLVQAWEKVNGRQPNVSELHFMLTTGRVKPPVEIQPRPPEPAEHLRTPIPPVASQEFRRVQPVEAQQSKKESRQPVDGLRHKLVAASLLKALAAKFHIADKRKFLFHLSHLIVVCAAVIGYCLVMRVFD